MTDPTGARNGHEAQTRLGGLLAQHGQQATPLTGVAPAGQVSAQVAGAAGPADVALPALLPGGLPVKPDVIQQLRLKVAQDIRDARKSRGVLQPGQEEEMAAAFAHRQIARWHTTEYVPTHPPLTHEQLEMVREEVLNLVFRAGSLQRLLDRDDVKHVTINGPLMYIESTAHPQQRVPSPFENDAQALEWVHSMSAQSGHGERQLSYASPWVDFVLPDGCRASATMLTTRVVISIRKHRVDSSWLGQLVQWGSIDPLLSAFLSACVKAKLNLVICGDMGTGKTTMMRALGREIPASETLVTIESDRELFLDTEDTPAHVIAFEARQSNGERDAAGRMTGEVTIADLVPVSLRYNAQRVMVGEVRGVEAVPMLEAMAAGGSGSMCTLHARSPEEVIDRLMLRLSMAGLADATAYRLIAGSIDLIIYLDKAALSEDSEAETHVLSHIWEITGRSEAGVALSELFTPREQDGRAVPTKTPMTERRMKQLERKGGFDRKWLAHYPDGMWEQSAPSRRAS